MRGITPFIPGWRKPITIARHAYGDLYKNTEAQVPAGAKAELLVTKEDGSQEKYLIHQFDGSGIIQGMHNTDKSIESFARSCFNFALDLSLIHISVWHTSTTTPCKAGLKMLTTIGLSSPLPKRSRCT